MNSPPIARLRSPTFPLAGSPVYQGGPIDWTSRPLAPFPSVLANGPVPASAPLFSEACAPSSEHMQTVRLDQICSAGH